MGLRRRITIAFGICLLFPVILCTVVGALIIQYQSATISAAYNMDSDTTTFLQNSPAVFGNLTKEQYKQLANLAIDDPTRLEDVKWLAELNEELSDRNSYVALRVGEEFLYCGDEEFNKRICHALPTYGQGTQTADTGWYISGEFPAMVRQVDFTTAEDKPATVFLVTDINQWLPQLKDTAFQALIALVLILNITAMVIVLWLYRSIMRPLAVLRTATDQIKEGNLECAIQGDEDDEIGQLQNAFDDMRVHLKEMSDRQVRYEQESREMMSYISHDMKTPLTAIKGYAEGILDGVADTPEKRERYLRTIYAKACDMERLVDELSFFSKVDRDAVTYNFQLVPVREYMEDCVDELRLDMEVKGIALTFSCECEDGTKAIMDPEQIKRVISNIVGNSVKYMDKPTGQVHIVITAEEDMIRVSIADNGCGIKESDLMHVFERFYRGDTSRGTKKGGSGLGLAIVRSIVTDHGGSVWARSTPGEGTEIVFTVQRHLEHLKEEEKTKEEEKVWIKS